MLVDAWLARAAAARPGSVAVQTPQGSRTYTELLAAARAGARELALHGAGPGRNVALELPAGLAFAEALHACLLLGAVAVPVDVRLAPEERERIRAGAAVVLDGPLEGTGRARGAGARAAAAVAEQHDLDSVAAVIHTSGTTAVPRPVELTYGNFLWSALGSAVALGSDPGERWLCAMPLSHVGGLSILLRSAIYATTAVVHEGFDTDRVLHALRAEGITVASLVATTLDRLLDAGLRDPPALRVALTGGGPVGRELVERGRAMGVPVALTYGLTEACSQVTTSPRAALSGAPLNAGPPLFCTRLRIAGDGEILVRGPTVARSAATHDGWLHTGDLGLLDESGGLLVSGRKADTIISGGENVAPAEVEAVLEGHPHVLEAAVVGRPDGRWGEAIVAWVLPRPGTQLRPDELAAHCARMLAAYKVPKQYVIADRPLPRTASGKLLRRALQ